MKSINRIYQYLELKGIKPHNFEKGAGLSNGYLATQKKRTADLGEGVLNKILDYCLDINPVWLLTGEGQMLKTDMQITDLSPIPAPTGQGVPYYNVDFCGGFDIMFNDQTRHPDGWVNFQPFSKADSWANITGHSMEPLISHGDMIAIKKVEDWRNYMLYGEIYGIVTEEYRTVKRVRKSPNPDTIILEPVNKDYDTQELELKKILSVWAVIGCAKLIF